MFIIQMGWKTLLLSSNTNTAIFLLVYKIHLSAVNENAYCCCDTRTITDNLFFQEFYDGKQRYETETF